MDTSIFEKWESEIRGYCRAYPTVFKGAKDAHMIDEAGKSYLDFFAGAGVINFGHNNEKMKNAVIDYIQGDGITHSLDMYSTTKRDFIKAFVETILEPRKMDYKLQFMGPTGTNAVETALKLARKVTGRHGVIAFSHGFHGMTLGALACTANSYFRNAAGVPLEYVHREPFNGGKDQIESLRCALEDSSSGLETPAAFILETIQAEGGVNVADEEWLQGLQALAKDFGILFIIDDIQVGCGRTGSYFSFEGMGLDPDIICLAKGIGGWGTPMAMNLIKPDHDIWQPGEHTGTFRGQNLSFVAGREALRYFENDDLAKEVEKKGKTMRKRLESIAKKHKKHGLTVRGRGMIQAIDMLEGTHSKEIQKVCFESGLLIGPCGTGGRVIKLIPPLTIEESELEKGLDLLEQGINQVMEAL